MVLRLTRLPARGRQAEPVSASKRSAARFLSSSMALWRSISSSPWASRRSSSTERTSLPSCSSAERFCLSPFPSSKASHAGGFFVEEIGQAPEQVFEVGFELGVAKRGRQGCRRGPRRRRPSGPDRARDGDRARPEPAGSRKAPILRARARWESFRARARKARR